MIKIYSGLLNLVKVWVCYFEKATDKEMYSKFKKLNEIMKEIHND